MIIILLCFILLEKNENFSLIIFFPLFLSVIFKNNILLKNFLQFLIGKRAKNKMSFQTLDYELFFFLTHDFICFIKLFKN